MPVPVSLVITVYNRERYLSAAIESVLAQTRQDFELLIWDDGSTDRSVEIAKEYAKKDARVRAVAAEHQGRGLALKKAIAQTSGIYIGWVDSDDLLASKAIEETASVLDAHPEIGFVYTDYLAIDTNGKVTGYGSRCQIPYSKAGLLRKFMTFHFRLIRRSVFEQVGGIDESLEYVEDYDLCLRLSEVTEVRRIKKPLYYYRNHLESICHQHQAEQSRRAHKAVERALERRRLRRSIATLPNWFQFSPKQLSQSLISSAVAGMMLSLAALPLTVAIDVNRAQAQSITSAGDLVNTSVTPEGDRFDITGGRLSRDGANLFHSFNKFGLDPNQTANFVSTPSIQNILGRINGGQPSVINGLIQVTGGNSNLYLMNPSGIIFGSNARLNVPADFTATTATSIGIGNGWFNASGDNNYGDLVGTPSSFAFNTAQPGSIVNAGQLGVDSGKNLTLVGGTVINTGSLTASEGNINVAAVPGESVIRISEPGHLLSLDVPLSTTSVTQPGNWTLPILSLPQLLTGPDAPQATGVSVNSNGQVVLTSSGTQVPSDTGTTIVSGSVDTSSGQIGGRVNVLGNKVGLVDANINASGDQGGGTVLIGGDYQGKGTVANASGTYVSPNSTISADAHFNGNGGTVIVWADDTTRFFGNISARGGVSGGDGGFVEVSGKKFLDFRGQVNTLAPLGNVGTLLLDPTNIEIVNVGFDANAILTNVDQFADPNFGTGITRLNVALINNATTNVTLQATNDITFNAPINTSFGIGITAQAGNNITVNQSITTFAGNLDFRANDNSASTATGTGSVIINAPIITNNATNSGGSFTSSGFNFNSTTGSLTTGGGDINITATNAINTGLIDSSGGVPGPTPIGNITLNAGGNITTGAISSSVGSASFFANSGSVSLSAGGDILTGAITSLVSINNPYAAEGGPVTLIAGGNITTGTIDSSASVLGGNGSVGNGGAIALQAQGNITTNAINTASVINNQAGNGTGGAISLISTGGAIDTSLGTLASFGQTAGAIALDAAGDVTTAQLNSGAGITGGDVTVTSRQGGIDTSRGIINPNTGSGTSGAVTLNANLDIVTGEIRATALTGNGNDITLTSTSGSINTTAADLNTSSSDGNAGKISLSALGNITTSALVSFSNAGNAGTITLSATNGQIAAGNITAISPTQTGDISITGNEINFTGTASSVNSNGNLLLQPGTLSQNIAIANSTDSGTNTLDLTTTDLDAIQSGFTSITIGRADGTGTIALNPFNFNAPVNIPGGSTLIGSNQNTTWNITGTDQGNLNSLFPNTLTFNNIKNISGGSGNDTFVFSDNASISGITNGNGGTDTLDYSAFTSPLTVNLQTIGVVGIEQMIGTTAAPSTLIGTNTSSTWNITGNNSGSVNGLNFSAFQNFTGSSSDNTFVFSNGGSISGNLDGGAGNLTLTGDEIAFSGSVSGTGNLILQPLTPTQSIKIGGSDSGSSSSLDLTGAKLGSLQNGFSTITIGRADGTGAITLAGDTTFNNPVTLQAPVGNGSIDTTGFTLTGANNATISLLANQGITTGTIINPGRTITLTSNNGNINTSSGTIDTSSTTGNGGEIAFSAAGNLTTAQLNSSSGGSGNGGNITLSSNGAVDTSAGSINSSSGSGNGGAIAFSAAGNLTTAQVNSSSGSSGNGGAIALTSNNGAINTTAGSINSASSSGNGGAIALSAAGNLTAAQVNSSSGGSGNGGAIALTSDNGAVDTTTGSINSSSGSGNGGAISLSATGNITSSSITSKSNGGAGGGISLTSQEGIVSSDNLNASGNTSGGKITVIAREQITAGQINSSAILGNGGDVTLDPIGDIQVDFINAQGGRQGSGGTVDIATQRFFIAKSTFLDQNGIVSSISTAGGTGGGAITIQHGGGFVNPFVVAGDVTNNGTVGNITTGSGPDDTLLPGTYFDLVRQGNIQIITIGSDVITVVSRDTQPEPQRQGRSSEPTDKISTTAKVSLNTIDILRNNIFKALSTGKLDVAVPLIEELRGQEYESYLGINSSETTAESVSDLGSSSQKPTQAVSLEQTQSRLSNIASQTGKTPAIIYVLAQPEQLDVILVTPNGQPILRSIREAKRADLLKMVVEFRSQVTDSRKKSGYLAPAQKLYQWLIAPLDAELKAQKIDTLAFSLDAGLRSLPLAALHDGQQFLVENYSIGLIPSINLVDTRYQDIKNLKVLAMGASKFTDQKPLPAVPVELSTIVGDRSVGTQNRELLPPSQSSPTTEGLWSGKSFLNAEFTLANLKSQRSKEAFGIIHLATHGEFKAGTPNNSYIQLWDTRLPLDQLRQLGWKNPPVELLVLSACRTAVGDEKAELGFGGLAVAAGVKSAVASLWYVSDEGTLGLMSEFYEQLKTASIKAEALRQAQIAMLKGQVQIKGGQLLTTGSRGAVPLPPEVAQSGEKNLSHPAYWAAFTMIGSPW